MRIRPIQLSAGSPPSTYALPTAMPFSLLLKNLYVCPVQDFHLFPRGENSCCGRKRRGVEGSCPMIPRKKRVQSLKQVRSQFAKQNFKKNPREYTCPKLFGLLLFVRASVKGKKEKNCQSFESTYDFFVSRPAGR